LLQKKEITVEEGKEILEHKTDTVSSIFKLFEHMGLIYKRVDLESKIAYFSFSKIGKEILLKEDTGGDLIQPLIPFFLSWLPLKIFLKYLQLYPGSDVETINSNLGSQVAFHTKEVKNLFNLKYVDVESGVDKPFNRHVIPNVLATIGGLLKLVKIEKKEGPYYLSPLGKYVANSIDLYNFNFAKLDYGFSYSKLALADFIERHASNIIILGDEKNTNDLQNFIKNYIKIKKLDNLNEIEYKTNEMEAILTKESSYISIYNNLINLSYDPIRVLELNANLIVLLNK